MEAYDAEGSQGGRRAISQISIGALTDQKRIRGPAIAASAETGLGAPSFLKALPCECWELQQFSSVPHHWLR